MFVLTMLAGMLVVVGMLCAMRVLVGVRMVVWVAMLVRVFMSMRHPIFMRVLMRMSVAVKVLMRGIVSAFHVKPRRVGCWFRAKKFPLLKRLGDEGGRPRCLAGSTEGVHRQRQFEAEETLGRHCRFGRCGDSSLRSE